ncbi:MAG: PepSY domain-containing protein [Pseudorhodoplanes sp.]|nr:PepSY domain-containing protein [Pseudorhodoplanes sp.]
MRHQRKFAVLKAWLLKIHRWITLIFSIPLAILIVTGLVLSFEPALTSGEVSKAVTLQSVEAALTKHDPAGAARSVVVRGYTGVLSIGLRPGEFAHVDLATNEAVASPGILAQIITTSRRLHETLLLDLGWLVTASTVAMLVLIALGVTMGWPRLRHSLAGWHKGTGWILLPLLILSPLTGLLLAFGVTFATPPAAGSGAPALPLREAIRVVGGQYDLSRVTWIRPMRGALRARVDDGGEMRLFTVTASGLQVTPRNWPRLIHEGNWHGYLSVFVNVVTSVGLVILISTGLLLWARRKLRRRPSAARA